MKRREAVQAGIATLVLSAAGMSLPSSADDVTTDSRALAMTDPNLIESIERNFRGTYGG